MLKRIREGFNAEDGFTLVELMLVVAILGILAGIAVPQLTGVRDEAKRGTLQSAAGNIRNALERHKAIEGTYPSGTGDQSITSMSELDDVVNNTDFSTMNEEITVSSYENDDGNYTLTIYHNGITGDGTNGVDITPGGIEPTTVTVSE